jgi:hypothetical protein
MNTLVRAYTPDDLRGLQRLFNCHLSTVIPGWALPAPYMAQHLACNPHQPIIDPSVIQRKTLVAIEGQWVVAAAHVLCYGDDQRVGEDYRGACNIAWLLGWAEDSEAMTATARCGVAAHGRV